MKKNKGFTLIELLAVIVVLAIIALIATPMVMNVVRNIKKESVEISVQNIMNVAENYYLTNLKEDNIPIKIDLTDSNLEYNGVHVEKGYFKYDTAGQVSGKMYINGFCVNVEKNGEITSEYMTNEDCNIDILITSGVTYYFNPEKNSSCTETEAKNNFSKNKGCLKWYSFLNDDSDTVRLILDHNTTATTNYNSSNYAEDTKLSHQLKNDTASWHSDIQKTVRLISALEISQIIGNKNWTSSDGIFYFHTGTSTKYVGDIGTNKFAWLFDYTKDCDEVGCAYIDDSTSGYWTSTTKGEDGHFWVVRKNGALVISHHIDTNMYGIRPVITVLKAQLG